MSLNSSTVSACVSLSVSLSCHPVALAQNQFWMTQFGTSDQDGANALAPDGTGGVMIAGFTGGSLGGQNAGDNDAYVARYDNAGKQVWISQFGSIWGESADGLASDGAGGAFVTGTADGGAGVGGEVFLARFDRNGNQSWLRQFGTNQTDKGVGVASDGAGGVFVTGWTNGSLTGTSAGSADVFLARYDSAGNQLWIKQLGTSAAEKVKGIAPDGAGGAVITGWTSGGMAGPNAGSADIFLAHYDRDGNQLWIRQVGTSEWDEANGLAVDGAGGVIFAGRTRGTLNGSNAGGHDVFLARYDGAGNPLWIRQFGTSEWEDALALVPNSVGGVIIAGYTLGNLGGPNAGSTDAFIARYDGDGNQQWLRQFGTGEWEEARALAFDGMGGVMVAGATGGNLNGPNAGFGDAYIARYDGAGFCYADCDQSTGVGVLDIFDFLCFQNSFVNSDPYACECDTSTGAGVCDIFDFLCFQDAFVAGCP